MITVYQSNLTEQLLATLSELLLDRPSSQPLLQPDQILVQNPDVAQWLKLELAKLHGVSANIEFPLPSAFMWRIFASLYPELPERSPYHKSQITLHLMAMLPSLLVLEEFAWLGSYLNKKDTLAQYQRYQLCHTIADIFDQYLMYRPEWIMAWEAGEWASIPPEHRWQGLLWQKLSAKMGQVHQLGVHRGELILSAKARLEQLTELPPSALPKRLFIFGISAMAEPIIALLNALANHVEIHWLQHNPCEQFWLDIVDEKQLAKLAASERYHHLSLLGQESYFEVGNPLLGAMGQLGREHLSLMLERLEGDSIDLFQPYPTEGALGHLQGQILSMCNRDQMEALTPQQRQSNQGKQVMSPDALANVQFHDCFSPMREVEVLKDALIAAFEADKSLTLNDVIIMMPDVGKYAPYIHSIFSGSADGVNMAYSINDLTAKQSTPVAQSLMSILNLPNGRFTLTEVFAILEVEQVMARFNLNPDILPQIYHWLTESGIRWGMDSEHRQQLSGQAFAQNSWAFGLERLMAGYCMHPSQGALDGIVPFDDIEGQGAFYLGELLHFTDTLTHICQQLSEAKSAPQWLALFTEIFQSLYLVDEECERISKAVMTALEALCEQCQLSQYDEPIELAIITDIVNQSITQQQGNQRFRTGIINFSSLLPMRAIPFKFIGLLGMNEGEFPTQTIPNHFDLMKHGRRRGDRSSKLDDRYLFLEALISARRHLHISYNGRSMFDASEQPPSILVSQLRDYLAQAWILAGDEDLEVAEAEANLLAKITHLHPLQPFNPNYFDANAPKSYAKRWLSQSESPIHAFNDAPIVPAQTLGVDNQYQHISIARFNAMLVHPTKQFIERTLGIYLSQEQALELDVEPMVLSGLTKYQIQERAYQWLKGDNGDNQQFIAHHLAKGALPVGSLTEERLEQEFEAMAPLIAVEQKLQVGEPLAKSVELLLGKSRIYGELQWWQGANEANQIVVKIGTIKSKDKLRAWLQHLFASATLATEELTTYLICAGHVHVYLPIEAEQAREQLMAYAEFYQQASQSAQPFFVDAAFTYLDANKKGNLEEAEIWDKVEATWLNDHKEVTEGRDPYNLRVWPSLSAVRDNLIALTEQLLGPYRDHPVKIMTSNKFLKG